MLYRRDICRRGPATWRGGARSSGAEKTGAATANPPGDETRTPTRAGGKVQGKLARLGAPNRGSSCPGDSGFRGATASSTGNFTFGLVARREQE